MANIIANALQKQTNGEVEKPILEQQILSNSRPASITDPLPLPPRINRDIRLVKSVIIFCMIEIVIVNAECRTVVSEKKHNY